MNRYWWVLIPVIFLAAFSGPIAAAVKTDGKLGSVKSFAQIGLQALEINEVSWQ